MPARALMAVAVSSLLLTACFSRGAVHSYRTEGGRPVADPGPDVAYVVWHDGTGWHLRARSEVGHLLEGLVEVERLRGVTPVGLAPEALRADRRAVAFSFVSEVRREVGFDWEGGCSEFSLFVDGDARPLRTFAGAYGASPPRVPFALCP